MKGTLLLMTKGKKKNPKKTGCLCSNSHQARKGSIIWAQGRYYLPLNLLISSFFIRLSVSLFPPFSLCTKYWSLSCFVFFYYLTLCLRFISVLLSQHLFLSYTLCVFSSLCVCLSGMVWLVLIYSHHYLVLGEDKHAFACLMNQTSPIPLSMRACTHSH